MKFNTTVKLLQYLGAFPVIIEPITNQNDKQLTIRLSKKYVCCAVIQAVLSCCRIKMYFDALKPSSSFEFLLMIFYGIEHMWVTAVTLLFLTNLKELYRCFQGCNHVLVSNDTVKGEGNFGSFAFFFFFLQIGNSTFFTVMAMSRSGVDQALFWLPKYFADLVTVLCHYCILTILKIMLVSYTKVNRRLSELSNRKTREYFSSSRSEISLIEELEDLAQKHWKTGDLLVNLNRAFGPLIFLFSSFIFSNFTLVVYYLSLKGALYQYHEHPAYYVHLYSHFYAVSNMLLTFLLLCLSSHQVYSEKQKTQVLLLRLLRRKSDQTANGLNIKIRVFVYQVRSRQLGLSGCELFRVDRPLFYGMVMVVISYFILLVQFKVVQRV